VGKTGIILAVITLFALDVEAGPQERLEARRHEIDALDQRLVELIQKRTRVVEAPYLARLSYRFIK
jgi:Chorismate mutase type II